MRDAVEYRNGQKNHWRRTVWNLCARASRVHPRDALVLYLPGSQDLDRPEARRRGFRDANLLAVERDSTIVRDLRARGVTTIGADLLTVVRSWPKDREVHLLFADLQCGVTEYVEELICCWMLSPAFSRCVLMLNLQRGRAESPYFREYVAKHPSLLDAVRRGIESHGEYGGILDDLTEKHRGLVAYVQALVLFMSICRALPASVVSPQLPRPGPQHGAVRLLPGYRSTSASPFMDSVVMAPFGIAGLAAVDYQSDAAVARRISAALAIRTQRARGSLAGATRRRGRAVDMFEGTEP